MSRVLIRKSDGYPVEFQTGKAPLGTLTQNAVNAGLDPDDYEEKYITTSDYEILAEEKIYGPEREKNKEKKRVKINEFKTKHSVSESFIKDLLDLL